MASLRFSTFNVENLFVRPKILSLRDNDRISQLLKDLAEFKTLMDRSSYAGVEARILELYLELSPYVDINLRSSQVGRDIVTRDKLIAKGRGDWEGFIDLTKTEFDDAQIKNTAKVIKTVKPQILGFVEVENRATMRRFNTEFLSSRFGSQLVIDGNDPRGIDVGMAADKRFPILDVRTNIFEFDSVGEVFSRDCLEVTFDLGGGKPLHVLQNHFKAKDRTPTKSDAKRKRQATRVAEILETRYNLKTDLVIVAGDLNDEPDSDPISPLAGADNLFNVHDLAGRPEADRWTYYYWSRKKFNSIDYILVSKGLKSCIAGSGIERRGIADLATITKGAEASFPEVDSWRVSASDHAAVWAEISL